MQYGWSQDKGENKEHLPGYLAQGLGRLWSREWRQGRQKRGEAAPRLESTSEVLRELEALSVIQAQHQGADKGT